MTTTFDLFKGHVVFVNPDGTLTESARRWLNQNIVPRVGGTTAMTNLELEAALEQAQMTPGAAADVPAGFADALQAPAVQTTVVESIDPDARIASLEAYVDRLARAINDLQQGTQ